jgi:hypothetical protein
VTGYRPDGQGDSWQGLGIFLFNTMFRPALGHTQPPIQWILGVKWLGHEVDHSLPSSAKVTEYVELYLQYIHISWHGVSVKHRDNYLYHQHFTSNLFLNQLPYNVFDP